MFKDILVPMVLGGISEPAIRAACTVAAAFDGRIIALAGVSIVAPSAETWKYYPAHVYATLHESAEATTSALAQSISQRLSRESVASEVRCAEQFWLTPAELTTLHARYADLVLLGIERKMTDAETRLFAGVLADGGRPVLLVPPQAPTRTAYERVLIAWKSTPEAARAVHDAMPLLQRARTIDLVMVEGGYKSRPSGDGEDSDIIAHLDRHGLQVNLVRRSDVGSSAGEEILCCADEGKADLIVAGGYSHPRAYEQVFGGVTRALLRRSPIPVLFSH